MQPIPPADDKASKVDPRPTTAGLAKPVVAASGGQFIVPRAEDGKAAVGSAATGTATASNVTRHPGTSKVSRVSGAAFKLDQDPREKSFMLELLRGGMAQVIYEKKTAYWSCSTPAPSKEQQVEDAKSMAKQFGIEDYTQCLPEYEERARETVEVLETASQSEGKVLDADRFSVVHALDPDSGQTHVCVIFKPRLAEDIAASPARFDLPPDPSPADIRRKVEYLSSPESFLKIKDTPMFSRMLYDHEHSVDMYHQLYGRSDFTERFHPMTGVIKGIIQSVPEEEMCRVVVPVGMVYFKGSDTVEQHAMANIANAEHIGKELDRALQSARETDPAASLSNVALNETLKRMYR